MRIQFFQLSPEHLHFLLNIHHHSTEISAVHREADGGGEEKEEEILTLQELHFHAAD